MMKLEPFPRCCSQFEMLGWPSLTDTLFRLEK